MFMIGMLELEFQPAVHKGDSLPISPSNLAGIIGEPAPERPVLGFLADDTRYRNSWPSRQPLNTIFILFSHLGSLQIEK
jgi:hypothetical protein